MISYYAKYNYVHVKSVVSPLLLTPCPLLEPLRSSSLQKYSPDSRSVGGRDSREVTALAACASPTAFKYELDYLVRITLEDDLLVLLAKSLAIKMEHQYTAEIWSLLWTEKTVPIYTPSNKHAAVVLFCLRSFSQFGETKYKWIDPVVSSIMQIKDNRKVNMKSSFTAAKEMEINSNISWREKAAVALLWDLFSWCAQTCLCLFNMDD